MRQKKRGAGNYCIIINYTCSGDFLAIMIVIPVTKDKGVKVKVKVMVYSLIPG